MPADKVKVKVIDLGGKQYTTVLPAKVTVQRLTPELVKAVKLPLEGPGGAPMHYDLMLDTEGGRVRLQENETLADAGAQEGAVLRITPRMEGGRSTEVCHALL